LDCAADRAQSAVLSTGSAQCKEGEMSPKRAPFARRSVWIVVGILSVVVVVGIVVAAYEINHLRNEYNGLNAQIQQLNSAIAVLKEALKLIGLQGK
jgi:hypothetical protein